MARILVRNPSTAVRGVLARVRRVDRWTALVVVLWLAIALPFALGERTLLQRDVFTTHLSYKWFGAQELAAGRVPATIPGWALGQPFAGNPNALPFYPGNLLYLVLPFWSAFNLHYLGHLLLAFFGMRALARALGQRQEAAVMAGLAYAGSGYAVTLLTFYNLLTVAAWVPVALTGLVRGGRRGTVIAGLAGGMALLGGEPITGALALPVAAVVACGAHGVRAGALVGLRSAALAIGLALPQLVATLRVAPHSFRGAHGLLLEQVTANDLHPWRLLELLLPLPWGVMSAPPPWGHWATAISPQAPYIFSLYVGVVALLLACVAAGRRRAWSALVLGALAAGWAAGLSAEVTQAVTLGLFRFPQKLLFPFTLALAPLAGWGLEAVLERPRLGRAVKLAGATLVVLGMVMLLNRASLAERLGETFADGAPHGTLMAQAFLWSAQVVLAGGLLLGAGAGIARRSAGALIALQLVGLVQLVPLVPSAPTSAFRGTPAWAERVGPGARVASAAHQYPLWEPRPPYSLEALWARGRSTLDRELLAPYYTLPLGLESPLAPDLDGLTAPLQVFLAANLVPTDWEGRVRWLRRLGVGALVRDSLRSGPDLERLDSRLRFAAATEILEVPAPRAFVFRPREARFAPTPRDAYLPIARGEIGDDVALVSSEVSHGAVGEARLISATPDEVVLEVEGEGGLVGVLRASQPFWRAELEDGTRLPTTTVDLVLLGVEVPAGSHRVRLWVPRGIEIAAGALALAALLAALIVWRRSA
jgi:hypothetical protein